MFISPSTYELVKDAVRAEELPPMKFKGKAEAMPVFNVTGLTPEADT